MDTKNLLGEHINQLVDTNDILSKHIQGGEHKTKHESSLTKLDLSGYFLTHGWRITKVYNSHICNTNKYGHYDGSTRDNLIVVLE